jgi:hypothetical protein
MNPWNIKALIAEVFCMKNNSYRLTFSISVSCKFYMCFTKLVQSVLCFWLYSHFSMMWEQLPYRAEVMSDIWVPTHEHINWYNSSFRWYTFFFFLLIQKGVNTLLPQFNYNSKCCNCSLCCSAWTAKLPTLSMPHKYSLCEIIALHLYNYFKASSYITENALHLH